MGNHTRGRHSLPTCNAYFEFWLARLPPCKLWGLHLWRSPTPKGECTVNIWLIESSWYEPVLNTCGVKWLGVVESPRQQKLVLALIAFRFVDTLWTEIWRSENGVKFFSRHFVDLNPTKAGGRRGKRGRGEGPRGEGGTFVSTRPPCQSAKNYEKSTLPFKEGWYQFQNSEQNMCFFFFFALQQTFVVS